MIVTVTASSSHPPPAVMLSPSNHLYCSFITSNSSPALLGFLLIHLDIGLSPLMFFCVSLSYSRLSISPFSSLGLNPSENTWNQLGFCSIILCWALTVLDDSVQTKRLITEKYSKLHPGGVELQRLLYQFNSHASTLHSPLAGSPCTQKWV